MKNIGYSDPPRVCRFTRFVGSLLLLAGLGAIVGWVIPRQDDLAADPDEKDRPFAQVAPTATARPSGCSPSRPTTPNWRPPRSLGTCRS